MSLRISHQIVASGFQTRTSSCSGKPLTPGTNLSSFRCTARGFVDSIKGVRLELQRWLSPRDEDAGPACVQKNAPTRAEAVHVDNVASCYADVDWCTS
jgi:hypothetical protein